MLTTVENVSYPLEMSGIPKKEARDLARKHLLSVGIDESKAKRFPSNLSGGEQQRVAIARALATGAKVLLADEPTGNLDTKNSENIMGILKSLAHDEGYCVVIVTHDLAVAEVCDSVYRMTDGVLKVERE